MSSRRFKPFVAHDVLSCHFLLRLSNYKLPYWMRRGKNLRNEALAAEWQVLRETCCKYRCGRAERNEGEDKKRPLPADNGADVRRWERKNSDSFFICVNLRHL
ncbi:MAG: hypothetical protein ABSG78_19930, partial [Verrucomicrobiota bacterium]